MKQSIVIIVIFTLANLVGASVYLFLSSAVIHTAPHLKHSVWPVLMIGPVAVLISIIFVYGAITWYASVQYGHRRGRRANGGAG